MAIVYRHIRLDINQPFYIGVGLTYVRAHNKINRSVAWKEVVSKTDYRVEILFDDLEWDVCYAKERELIALYGRQLDGGILVNIANGGKGRAGKYGPLSKSHREKLSIANTGSRHHMWGKSPSPETRAKIGIAFKNKPRPKEFGEMLSAIKKGAPALNKAEVVAYNKDGKLVGRYSSMSQAAVELSVSVANICNVCNGKLKQTKGYFFEKCITR